MTTIAHTRVSLAAALLAAAALLGAAAAAASPAPHHAYPTASKYEGSQPDTMGHG
jgi:ABC-type sugar transport system substrate-binding protein